MSQQSRSTPESRVEVGTELLRLDFDPRTSDTMYNYIHLRKPGESRWRRAHNFGIDVRGRLTNGDPEIKNLIGMNLKLHRDGNVMRVVYPRPLVQYRHFDDKVGGPAIARQYPDLPSEQVASIPHCDASAEFVYELDEKKPSFVMRGRVLSGSIANLTYIISALWTDNHALPTHQYVEDFPEYDLSKPESNDIREIGIENVAYCLFYRHDGNGVPFALLPERPIPARVCNYFDNWQCLRDFRLASLNQQYVPESPAVKDTNDAGYITEPDEAGRFAGVRVAFFPELGWQAHIRAHDLRKRLVAAIEEDYLAAAKGWERVKHNLPRKLTTSGRVRY